jgi:hypothetical protein
MNDLVDAVTTRIRAPYFGFSLLAFVALNWRGLFLLFATEGTPEQRLDAFDAATTVFSVYVLPLVVGVAVAAVAPWVRLFFSRIWIKPLQLIDFITIEGEHQRTIQKTKLEQARTELFANKESELINRAVRDAEVDKIEDDDLRNSLKSEIEMLRRQRDQLSMEAKSPVFEPIEFDLLVAALKGDGSINVREYIGGRNIQAGALKFGEESPEAFAIAEHGLNSLLRKGYLVRRGPNRYELTADGYVVAKDARALIHE